MKSGEDDGRSKLKKYKTDVVQMSLADRYSQLQESENTWKKKVHAHKHALTNQWGHLSIDEKNAPC